jgi:hypothetical protein
MHGDATESLPQYAGKRVRFAEVAVELIQRKPVSILRLLYVIMSFDGEGRIDVSEQKKARRLSADMMVPFAMEGGPSRIIDATHHFAKKRFDHQYRWTPSPEIEKAIMDAIFGKDRL